MLAARETQEGRCPLLGLEIWVPVTARNVGSDLVGDITNPMLAFCYDFEVALIFYQQVQHTVLYYSYHSDYI